MKTKHNLTLMLLAIGSLSIIAAPMGTGFIYQGRLHQGDSPAPDGWYDFQFHAYAEATGGSALGNPVYLTLPVTNGLFTAQLDFGAGVFTGEARWLEIHVRPFNGGRPMLLEPRQPITPAPYALYAVASGGSSVALGEGVVSNLNLSANSVTTDKIVDGTITVDDVNPNTFWNVGGNVMTSPPDDFIGTIDPLPFRIRVNNVHAMRFEPGDPPNVIGGFVGNSVAQSIRGATIGGGGENGAANQVTADFGTISGGEYNHVDASRANIGGGFNNTIQTLADDATIGGGYFNRIQTSADHGTIGGGIENTIATNAYVATIGGGYGNRITDEFGTIGGGRDNEAGNDNTPSADASFASVGGGRGNAARASYSTIGGGTNNTIETSADWATIGGGDRNTIQTFADSATISGGTGNIIETNAFLSAIGGGWTNRIEAQTFFATIGGGGKNNIQDYASSTTISGGMQNEIRVGSDGATIGGGEGNTIHEYGDFSTICGGSYNHIRTNAGSATIVGGQGNNVRADFGAIGGGGGNHILEDSYSTMIGGGYNNMIQTNAPYATIGGGEDNTIGSDANYATIPGGYDNAATGSYSFAAGRRAKANHQGSFVWGDSTDADFLSLRDDQFRIRANGGAAFEVNGAWVDIWVTDGKAIRTSTGAYLTVGGEWHDVSDAARKMGFVPIDRLHVLSRLVQMPISTWSYKVEDPNVRHIGPTAQDFHAAFGLGSDDKTIGSLDADGVALAAIQGLNQKLEARCQALEARLEQKETEIEQLNQKTSRMDELERRLLAMEKLLNQQTAMISGGEQ